MLLGITTTEDSLTRVGGLMARATPLQKPYGAIQKCAVQADRGFNKHLAGDSGCGRTMKRPTRFKDPLKQSAQSAGALSAGALSAGALSAVSYTHLTLPTKRIV